MWSGLTKHSIEIDRAVHVSALIGLAIGDTVGAPLEFLDAISAPYPYWMTRTTQSTSRWIQIMMVVTIIRIRTYRGNYTYNNNDGAYI